MRQKQQRSRKEARVKSHFCSGTASAFTYREHRILILSLMVLPIVSFFEPAKIKTEELRMSKEEWECG